MSGNLYNLKKGVAEIDDIKGLEALTASEILRAVDVSARIVNVTASTLAVTEATHEGKIVTLNRAAGIAVTLPAATGSGGVYRFIIGTTVTSNSTTIKVTGNDVMFGIASVIDDTPAIIGWATAVDTDTITFNGTTTGGYKGDYVELVDFATDCWLVRITGRATGSEATPFSATV